MGLIINPRQIIKDGITSLRDVWSSSKVSTELSGKQATLVSGVNIKTVNTHSLLGSGDIHISGGGDIPKINMTATTATLDPNKFYVWGEVASLDISLAAETAGIQNVYKFQFQSGATATTLTLPSSVKWSENNVVVIKKDTTYILSICNNTIRLDYAYYSGLLPIDFQAVEYLQSQSGHNSYIDTNLLINSNVYSIVLNVATTTTSGDNRIIASSINSSTYMLAMFHSGKISLSNVTPTIATISYSSNILYKIELKSDGINRTSSINDVVYYTNSSLQANSRLFLFARNNNGSADLFTPNTKIYNFSVTVDGITMCNMIPCYCLEAVENYTGVTVPANTAGFYDVTRAKFYTNAGTGNFIVGPDI